MDVVKGNWKRTMFVKAWERCRSSLGRICSKKSSSNNKNNSYLTRSNSWNGSSTTKKTSGEEGNNNNNRRRKTTAQVVPEGCFPVYVGPEKQMFVVETKFANHPLFRILLEDAESEYGFNSEGPLLLPCDVNLFCRVLAEMESGDDDYSDDISTATATPICSLFVLCSPLRPASNRRGMMNKGGYGAYRLLAPSRLLKLNR